MPATDQLVQEIRGTARERSGIPLAEVLGWRDGSRRSQLIEQTVGEISVTRAYFRGEPALLVVKPAEISDSYSPEALLDKAAYAGYHAAIDWGVLSTDEGLTVFHTRWVRNRDWYRLPQLPWSSLEAALPLLTALSPDGLTDGALLRVATQSYYTADQYLRPLDEELVSCLDGWRRRALAVSTSSSGVDESLQILFAQMFVLRTVEDRALAVGLRPLSDVLRSGDIDRSLLDSLFDEARDRVQSDLFARHVGAEIQDQIIAGVIRDLYEPRHLPVRTRYNFAWLDADVLGRAYEKYLSRVLEPLPPSEQNDLFGVFRQVGERDVRHQEGVYYTPSYLARSLVAQAIDPIVDTIQADFIAHPRTPEHLVESGSTLAVTSLQDGQLSPVGDRTQLPVIGDFSCGSGSFLVAAADHLLRRLREIEPRRSWAHELVRGRHLIGIDKDPRAVTLTRLNLYIRLTAEPEALPLPSLESCIVAGDSLSEEPWGSLPVDYDVVLGNPPFVATGSQLSREQLVTRFESAQGRFDISYLFIELAIRKLATHGVLSLVVPNRVFRNRDAGPIRACLTETTDVLCAIDFGAQEVFKGIGAYVGTITAKKRIPTDAEVNTLRVVAVNAIADVSFLGALLIRAAETDGELKNDVLEKFDIPHPRGAAPWLLIPPAARTRNLALGARSVTLAEIAPTRQGIRTGANDIFIVTVESSAGGVARVTNAGGDTATLETELLRPAIFGTEIQRYDKVRATKHLLYPYRRGVLIEESEFRSQYPNTWNYLERYRYPLADRGSLKGTGGKWYELIRKRDEAWLTSPKLLIRDLITETAFAIDEAGETFLAGGTAVVPENPDMLWPLLGYLNSSVVTERLRQSTPAFRGGFQKVEPRHLDMIPVPYRLLRDADFARSIASAARRAADARASEQFTSLREAEESINLLIQQLLDQPVGDLDFDEAASDGFSSFF